MNAIRQLVCRSRFHPTKATAPLVCAISLVVPLASGCFDFADTIAVRNQTEAPLLVSVSMTEPFARYLCDGSGSDLERFEGEAEFEVPPGERICLEGPARPHEEAYDARDLLTHLEIRRGGAVCVESDGEAVREYFAAEGMHKTWPIDDSQCPESESAP